MLQTERVVPQSLQDEVRVIARDDSGEQRSMPARA